MQKIIAWIQLFRFRYHLSYALVAGGALRVSGLDALESLMRAYLAFGVLLYGGIYALNGIADARSDARHPRKRLRPVASGVISRGDAALAAVCLIAGAFVLAMLWFTPTVIGWFAAFLIVNVFYTFAARAVPILDILVNASTYPMRVMLGAALVENTVEPVLVALVLLFAVGAAALRRVVECDEPGWQARESLLRSPKYALLALRVLPALGLVLLLGIWPLVCCLVLGVYLTVIFGLPALRPTRTCLVRLWTA